MIQDEKILNLNLGIALIILSAFALIAAMTIPAWSYLCILFAACLFLNGILIVTIYMGPTERFVMPHYQGPIPDYPLDPVTEQPDTDPTPSPEMFGMGLFIIPPLSVPEPKKSKRKSKKKNPKSKKTQKV